MGVFLLFLDRFFSGRMIIKFLAIPIIVVNTCVYPGKNVTSELWELSQFLGHIGLAWANNTDHIRLIRVFTLYILSASFGSIVTVKSICSKDYVH